MIDLLNTHKLQLQLIITLLTGLHTLKIAVNYNTNNKVFNVCLLVAAW
jgi:hypothetical protein